MGVFLKAPSRQKSPKSPNPRFRLIAHGWHGWHNRNANRLQSKRRASRYHYRLSLGIKDDPRLSKGSVHDAIPARCRPAADRHVLFRRLQHHADTIERLPYLPPDESSRRFLVIRHVRADQLQRSKPLRGLLQRIHELHLWAAGERRIWWHDQGLRLSPVRMSWNSTMHSVLRMNRGDGYSCQALILTLRELI